MTTVDEEGNEVETQRRPITVSVSISRFPAGLAKHPASYRSGSHTGTAGQRGQRLQCREVRCIYWNGGLDPRHRRAPSSGRDGFCSPHWGGLGEPGHLGVWLPEGPLHRGRPLGAIPAWIWRYPPAPPSGPPCPGTVTAAQYHSSYGYYVMIDHGNGLSTLYAHNSQLLVRVGQTVEAGESYLCPAAPPAYNPPPPHFEVRVKRTENKPQILPANHIIRGVREYELNPEYGFCLIAAYETAAGLPDNERITRTDGTWRPGVTEQQAASLYRQAQALLAPETKLLSTSRESLIDQMRDALLSRELSVGDTVLFAATEPYGGPGDFALRGGASSSPLTRTQNLLRTGTFFPRWTTSLSTMCWGSHDRSVSEEHYGFPTHPPLCWGNTLSWRSGICVKQRLRWNTLCGQPASFIRGSENTMQAMGGMS